MSKLYEIWKSNDSYRPVLIWGPSDADLKALGKEFKEKYKTELKRPPNDSPEAQMGIADYIKMRNDESAELMRADGLDVGSPECVGSSQWVFDCFIKWLLKRPPQTGRVPYPPPWHLATTTEFCFR